MKPNDESSPSSKGSKGRLRGLPPGAGTGVGCLRGLPLGLLGVATGVGCPRGLPLGLLGMVTGIEGC